MRFIQIDADAGSFEILEQETRRDAVGESKRSTHFAQ